MTRWQPSSIRQLPLYCNRRHGFRRGRNSNTVPSSDSIPSSPCPRVSANRNSSGAMRTHSRWPSTCAVSGAWCPPPVHRKSRSLVVTDPIQLRSNFTRMRAGPLKHTEELTTPDIPINMLTENRILWITGSAVQPSAGLPSSHSFHGEVSSYDRLLLSIPLVQLCAAHNTKIAPCSLPRPKAPLRSGD